MVEEVGRGWTVVGKPIRFAVVPTYRCNADCEQCNRMLGVMPWPDSDLSLDDLKLGWERIQRAGIEVEKARVTGGEPLLHPRFEEVMELIGKTFNKEYVANGNETVVFTNGSIPQPESCTSWRYNTSELGAEKTKNLKPPMISPADLGVECKCGAGVFCFRQRGCGRLFDAHGFSCCIFAGAIGRAIGIDPYSARPVIDSRRDVCRHCVFAVGVHKAHRLYEAMGRGEFEYPTVTYRRAIERFRTKGPFPLKKFQEREC